MSFDKKKIGAKIAALRKDRTPTQEQQTSVMKIRKLRNYCLKHMNFKNILS